MSIFAFVNGYISALAAPMTTSGTTLTPGNTVDAPTLDPTAANPAVAPMIVDVDPATGMPTANSELVLVTDTRTVPWTVVRANEKVVGGRAQGSPVAHAAGVPIAFVASAAALQALVNPTFSQLTGVSGWGAAHDNDVATWVSGVLVPQAPAVPSLSNGYAINKSGVSDGHSTVSSTTAFAGGNVVTVTDGAGNPLQITLPANPGRGVLLNTVIPMVRDGGTNVGLQVVLGISETTASATLTAAGLTPLSFSGAGHDTVPAVANSPFVTRLQGAYLDPSILTVARTYTVNYQIYNAIAGATNVGAWVQNSNTADVVVSGVTFRQGSRLWATFA